MTGMTRKASQSVHLTSRRAQVLAKLLTDVTAVLPDHGVTVEPGPQMMTYVTFWFAGEGLEYLVGPQPDPSPTGLVKTVRVGPRTMGVEYVEAMTLAEYAARHAVAA